MITIIKEIPEQVENDTVFEIATNNISYFTHGFFKYPCKFIPQIPNWAIRKYSKTGDLVIDPFAGSGTTLVEAVLAERNGLAIDFDTLSRLLCRTKTRLLDKGQIEFIRSAKTTLTNPLTSPSNFVPDLHNTSHWFSAQNIIDLLSVKSNIEDLYSKTKDEAIYEFLLVCFAAIIKKCSYADEVSPKPYVSKRFIKTPWLVASAINRTIENYLVELEKFQSCQLGKCIVAADDARNINTPEYYGQVDLAITSPPYINAFDYVRSLRLENAWLGYYGDSNIIEIKRKQVGTESIPAITYRQEIEATNNSVLDLLISQVAKTDQKRAYIVWKYFYDMSLNFSQVFRLLKNDGHYIVVIGDSKIRGIDIPTHKILIEIASQNGFILDNKFSYIIKNRYIRIPRSGQGGFIDKDWILDLRKTNG